MHRRSFLHPDDAYRNPDASKKRQSSSLHAPDIFVVPPEEDQTPPWCCYNSQQGLADEEEDEYFLRYPQASTYTPYFHRDAPGFEDLIMPSRKGTSETRSIVDALGDADDDSEHELSHEGVGMCLEEDEEEADGMVTEMGRNHGRIFYHPREQRSLPQPLSPHQEAGSDNDSDVIEIVKVRRKSAFVADDPDFFAPSGSDFGVNNISTFRTRATKAFQSFKGSLRASSKVAPKFTDSGGSSHASYTKPSLKLRAKSLSKRTRAQDVFSPIENIPEPERSKTPGLSRRPSSSLSQFFSPALRRRASSKSITICTPEAVAPPLIESSFRKSKPKPSNISTTLPRSFSSVVQTQEMERTSETDDEPTPTKESHDRLSEDDQPTPSWRTYGVRDADLRGSLKSTSPTPPRSDSPAPVNRPTRKPFSVLNLHKLFIKSGARNPSDPVPRSQNQAPSNSSAASTCPSLSSTPTSEWSGRTSPTLDSIPQTPTSFDENETRRTIVPVESCSTVGSGMSPGPSLQSAAVSSWSSGSCPSDATAATRGSTSSDREYGPNRHRETMITTAVRTESPFYLSTSTDLDVKPLRPSMSSLHAAVSTSTASNVSYDASSRVSESTIPSPLEASQGPDCFNISLKLDIDLDLGLGINLSPSASGGMLSSNNIKRPVVNNPTSQRRGRGGSVTSSISLKSIGSRLGIGKQENPSVPPHSRVRRDITEDGEGEMRLNSMHFEDISFDVDNFVTH